METVLSRWEGKGGYLILWIKTKKFFFNIILIVEQISGSISKTSSCKRVLRLFCLLPHPRPHYPGTGTIISWTRMGISQQSELLQHTASRHSTHF